MVTGASGGGKDGVCDGGSMGLGAINFNVLKSRELSLYKHGNNIDYSSDSGSDQGHRERNGGGGKLPQGLKVHGALLQPMLQDLYGAS